MCQKLIEAPKEVSTQQQAPKALVCAAKQIIVDDNNNNVNDDHEDNSNNNNHNHKHDRNLAQSLVVNKRPVERQQQTRKPQQLQQQPQLQLQPASRSRNMILPLNNDKTNNKYSSITSSSSKEQIKHRHRQVAPLASLDCSITEPVSGVESPSRTPTETPTLSGYFDCDQLSDMIDDSLFEITNTGCLSQSVTQQQKQKQKQQQQQILLNTADNNTTTNNDKNVADLRQTLTNKSSNSSKMDQNKRQENQTTLESSIKSSVKTTALVGGNKPATLVNYYRPYDYSSTSKIPNSTFSTTKNASSSVKLVTNNPVLSPNNNPSINKQRSKSARFSSTTLTASNNIPLSSSYVAKSNHNNHNRPSASSQVATNHHHNHHHHHHHHDHRAHKSGNNKQVEFSQQQQQQQRVRRKTRSNPDVRDDSEVRKSCEENADDSLCATCREQELKKKKDGKKRFTFSLFNLFTGGGSGNDNRNQSSGGGSGGGSGNHATCIHKQNFINDTAMTSSMKQAGSNQVKGISLLSSQSNLSSSSAVSSSSSSASSTLSSSSAETTPREATNNSSSPIYKPASSSQRLLDVGTRKNTKTNTNGVGSHIKSRDSIRLTNQRKQRNIKAENQQQQQKTYNFEISNSYTNLRNDSKANSELLLDFPNEEQQQTNGNNTLKAANATAGELRTSQSSYSIHQQQQRKGSGRASNGKQHQHQQRQAKCVKFTTPDRVMILPSLSSNHKTSGTQANLPPADLQPPAPIIKRSVPKSSSYSQTESNKNLYEMLARYEGNSYLISEINEKLKLNETIASPMSALDLEENQQQQREKKGEDEKRQRELLVASNSDSNSNSNSNSNLNSNSNFNSSIANACDDYVDTNINCLQTNLVPENNVTMSNDLLSDVQPQQPLEGFTQQSKTSIDKEEP